MRVFLAFLLVILLATSAAAGGARRVVVETARITVGQIVPGAPEDLRGVDLGPAPPPGGTRVLTSKEVARGIRRSGFEIDARTLPTRVRVTSAARHLQPNELATMARPAIERALPRGALLKKLTVHRKIVVSPRAKLGAAKVARLPRRAGTLRSTATVEVINGENVVLRVPISILVEMDEEAARPDLPKGSRIALVIERRTARISMRGVALGDANVGDVIRFRVARTGRVVKAKVLSRRQARLVEAG